MSAVFLLSEVCMLHNFLTVSMEKPRVTEGQTPSTLRPVPGDKHVLIVPPGGKIHFGSRDTLLDLGGLTYRFKISSNPEDTFFSFVCLTDPRRVQLLPVLPLCMNYPMVAFAGTAYWNSQANLYTHLNLKRLGDSLNYGPNMRFVLDTCAGHLAQITTNQPGITSPTYKVFFKASVIHRRGAPEPYIQVSNLTKVPTRTLKAGSA
jgi:hypothetical protein